MSESPQKVLYHLILKPISELCASLPASLGILHSSVLFSEAQLSILISLASPLVSLFSETEIMCDSASRFCKLPTQSGQRLQLQQFESVFDLCSCQPACIADERNSLTSSKFRKGLIIRPCCRIPWMTATCCRRTSLAFRLLKGRRQTSQVQLNEYLSIPSVFRSALGATTSRYEMVSSAPTGISLMACMKICPSVGDQVFCMLGEQEWLMREQVSKTPPLVDKPSCRTLV